jgi:hypothetical protein
VMMATESIGIVVIALPEVCGLCRFVVPQS